MDFLQKHLAWFSKFYLRLQSKNCGRKVFLFYFSELFRNLSKRFSDFWPKVFKKLSKLPSACADEQFLAWRNFQKFWTVLDFLQKPLAWFSKLYLRVQSKNSGRNKFFILLFRIFSDFEQNFFRFLAKKLQEVIKTTFYVSRRSVCGLNFFLNHEPLWILCRNLWHGSQNSFWVSRVKIAEELVFLFFFSYFFRILSKKFSDFWPKNLKKLWKLPSACADEQFLAWNFFQKFWTVLDLLQKPLAWFSNFYLRVQRKNSGRNNFFILLFRFFSDFERNFFSDFWPKNF